MSDVRHFVLDGLRLELVLRGDRGVLEPFTAGLLEVEPAGRPDVLVEADVGGEPVSPPAGGAASFFQASVRVLTREDGWVLRRAGAWAAVTRAPPRIVARCGDDLVARRVLARLMLPVALALALRELSRFHLHAGFVVDEDHAWLLVGPSGAGKSSSALALTAAGMRPLADDAVYIGPGGRVAPIGRAFHLSARVRSAFADLVGEAVPLEDPDRAEAFIARPSAQSIVPTALFLLEGPGPSTHIDPCSHGEAVGRLLEQAALTAVHGATRIEEHLATLAQLASRPSRLLRPGPDALADPASFRAALRRSLSGGP